MNNPFTFFVNLLVEMTAREVKARYKNTVFGFAWAFINPVIQMVVIGVIFNNIVWLHGKNYFLFVYSGLVLWNSFSLSLSKATPSILYERALIRKAKFPYEIIPLSIVFSNLIHMIPALLIIIFIIIFTQPASFTQIGIMLLAVLLQLAFTIGVSLCTTSLNVRYRDINFLVQAILVIWFYATPIIYPITMLPPQFSWLWFINPLTGPTLLMQHAVSDSAAPTSLLTLVNTTTIFVILYVGIMVFQKHSPYFDDLI